LADDPELKFEVNQTHTVVRSVAPSESAYCNANVCCAPDPLPGVTDAVAGGVLVAWIIVLSAPLALADPPPVTLTEFTCGEVALAPTFTVAVIAG
jgi:hypothetical protein